MKNKLEIYPSHPYIAVVEGRYYHINESQYLAILEDMGDGKGTIIITYHDPKTAEDRKIPLNLYKLTELDKSEVVRENNWKIQKGWVCKDGRLVDTQEDCSGNEAFHHLEEKGVGFEGMFGHARTVEARASMIAGLFCGAARHNALPKFDHIWKEWDLDWAKVENKIKGHAKSDNEKILALEYVSSYRGKRE